MIPNGIVLPARSSPGVNGLPEFLDPMEWFRTEREYTRSQFEHWLEDHAEAILDRVLERRTHLRRGSRGTIGSDLP